MNKILVLRAFDKAEEELFEKGILKPSLTQIATELSQYIEEQKKFTLGERSLRIYRGDAIKLEKEEKDINIKQLVVVNALCEYLGFDNYPSFVQNLGTNNIKTTQIPSIEKMSISLKIAIVISALLILSFFIYNYTHRQRWMYWEGNHYTEINFDSKKYADGQIKLYNEENILHLKKVEVNCDTIFFNADKSVKFWYGRNKSKELEYFTYPGLHPQTGKTLRPITNYMINKWICENDKDE